MREPEPLRVLGSKIFTIKMKSSLQRAMFFHLVLSQEGWACQIIEHELESTRTEWNPGEQTGNYI